MYVRERHLDATEMLIFAGAKKGGQERETFAANFRHALVFTEL